MKDESLQAAVRRDAVPSMSSGPRAFLKNSLLHQRNTLRIAAARCAKAYRGHAGGFEAAARRLAVLYGAASKLFGDELDRLDGSPSTLTEAYCQEMGDRGTSLSGSTLLYCKVARHDGLAMSWREVWEVFRDRYPGRWACQMFPPEEALMDEANIYHLLVWPEGEAPQGCDLRPGSSGG